ncbi:MAG: hypothetical protein ABIE14_03920 [Patescibacteria group bacterium]
MTELLAQLSHRKKTFLIAIGATIVVVIISIFLSANNIRSSVVGTIDASTYQAIHLDTGETYFGKITEAEEDFITITDVYYFLDGSKKKLVKRGKEVHAPDDSLTINNSHVLTTENLSENSPVVKAILKYLENKN